MRAKIYMIESNKGEKVYVGSTTNMNRRWGSHTSQFKKNKSTTSSKLLFDEYGVENCYFTVLEEFEYEDQKQRADVEDFWMLILGDCCVNEKRAGGESRCEHNRDRYTCIDCQGSGICEHNRQRRHCKDCGGSQFCVHNRERNYCRDCGGSSICIHNKRHSYCKECGGSQICEHDRIRSFCKECGGSSFCEHNRRRSRCKDCKDCKN